MKQIYFTKENIIEESQKLISSIGENYVKLDGFNKNVALVLLDFQKFFFDSNSHAHVPSAVSIIQGIKDLQECFFINGLPVIHTRHLNDETNAGQMNTWWRDTITRDNPMSELIDQIRDDRAYIVEKSQYDAFYNTDLEDYLKKLNVKTVVLVGVMTHLCLETTARSAFIRDFEVFAPVDGTATYNYDFHASTMRNLAHGFCSMTLVSDFINLNGGVA